MDRASLCGLEWSLCVRHYSLGERFRPQRLRSQVTNSHAHCCVSCLLPLLFFFKIHLFFDRCSYAGHAEVLSQLLQYGGEVNREGEMRRTPLHEACTRGHAACVSLLIQKGKRVLHLSASFYLLLSLGYILLPLFWFFSKSYNRCDCYSARPGWLCTSAHGCQYWNVRCSEDFVGHKGMWYVYPNKKSYLL